MAVSHALSSPAFRRSAVLLTAAVISELGCFGHATGERLLEGAGVALEGDVIVMETTPEGWEASIHFAFQNVTSKKVSLVNCRGAFGLRLERQVEGDWVMAWSPVTAACLSAPIVIKPGDEHNHVLHVFAGRPDSNFHPQWEVEPIDGTYRLVVLGAYWNYDHSGPEWGDLVPLEFRTSEPFDIREE